MEVNFMHGKVAFFACPEQTGAMYIWLVIRH